MSELDIYIHDGEAGRVAESILNGNISYEIREQFPSQEELFAACRALAILDELENMSIKYRTLDWFRTLQRQYERRANDVHSHPSQH